MACAATVAKQLGMDPDDIRVISQICRRRVRLERRRHLAHRLDRDRRAAAGRPVKLVPTRDQGYTIATYRAETRHRIQLGADADGRLLAFRHEGWEVTSRPSYYNVSGTETTARMYACPNITTRVNIVHADRNTPGFMRAPPDTPYMFPLECAMDELAHQLGIDPIELRRRNEPTVDPVTRLPFSSRHLIDLLRAGAAQFGWDRAQPAPGSMQRWRLAGRLRLRQRGLCAPTSPRPARA